MPSSPMLLPCLCLVCLLLSLRSVSSEDIIEEDDYAHFTWNYGPFLFDLDSDPTEDTNIYYDTSGRISEVKELLTKFRDKYADSVAEPQIPTETGMKSAWKVCGGTCPWLTNATTDDDRVTVDTTQIYDYKEAPHIVFVLVDDWGYNDVGYHSTYLSWTTPTIDRLASEGVKLENYYTHYSCAPSRGALMTGRYAFKLGMHIANDGSELPLYEVTLAQELKTAGYVNYMVGKWHIGFSTDYHLPTQRGFDHFFGYYNGFIDYWTKEFKGYVDLHDGDDIVSEEVYLDETTHNAYVLERKAEEFIEYHASTYPHKPMFLYYALQLIHGEWAAPQSFIDRCAVPDDIEDDSLATITQTYCAMNVMLDEVVTNLTCTLEDNGFADNTVMIIVSDNGGENTVLGNNYPFRGAKGSFYNGGVRAVGLVHSPRIPYSIRGQSYNGLLHITDWYPTLMSLATNNEWSEGVLSQDFDGTNNLDAILYGNDSNTGHIVHYHDSFNCSIQTPSFKLVAGFDIPDYGDVEFYFDSDQNPDGVNTKCDSPTLMTSYYSGLATDDDDDYYTDDDDQALSNYSYVRIVAMALAVVCIASAAAIYVYLNMRKSSLDRLHVGDDDKDTSPLVEKRLTYDSL